MIADTHDTITRRAGTGAETAALPLLPDTDRVELALGRALVGEVTENLSRVAFAVAGRSLRLTFGFYEHPGLADTAAVAAIHERVARALPLLDLTDETVRDVPPRRDARTVFARK